MAHAGGESWLLQVVFWPAHGMWLAPHRHKVSGCKCFFLRFTCVLCSVFWLYTRRGHQILLLMVVNQHVIAGNWIQNLWKSNHCSWPLNHLSSPKVVLYRKENHERREDDINNVFEDQMWQEGLWVTEMENYSCPNLAVRVCANSTEVLNVGFSLLYVVLRDKHTSS